MEPGGTSKGVSLDDRLAITELLSKYGLLLDSRRIEAWMGLFEPAASIEIVGRPLINSEDGRRELAVNSPRGVHLAAPPIITNGSVHATGAAEQSFLFHNLGTGGFRAGWYEDTLIKNDGRWYFSRRLIRFFESS